MQACVGDCAPGGRRLNAAVLTVPVGLKKREEDGPRGCPAAGARFVSPSPGGGCEHGSASGRRLEADCSLQSGVGGQCVCKIPDWYFYH